MKIGFDILAEAGPHGRRLRFRGNPAALLILAALLLLLAASCWSAADFLWDHYGAYEGTVVSIERHWTDHLTSESGGLEHMVIRTPRGRQIDKVISIEVRVANHIGPGDYVVKQRGFAHRVRRVEP